MKGAGLLRNLEYKFQNEKLKRRPALAVHLSIEWHQVSQSSPLLLSSTYGSTRLAPFSLKWAERVVKVGFKKRSDRQKKQSF